jgi:hypothetical protein
MRRVVLVGATGVFGARLAARLATWPELDLVLVARRPEPLEGLRARIAAGAKAAISVARADRTHPDEIVALAPWAVIDAAGPFGQPDFQLARAVIEAGAHWIDLADSRAYVAAFAPALDALARRKGVLAVACASSSPAITQAALARITAGWRSVARASSVIAPAAQVTGLSVVQTVLGQLGRRISCFRGGAWVRRPAWGDLRRLRIAGLGRRLAALADTPDLDFLPVAAREEGLFFAAIQPPLLMRLIWLAAWPVGLGLAPTLRPLAGVLRTLANWLAPLGSPRGGMAVFAEGESANGAPRQSRWSLVAERGAGPAIPSAPASAVLRALVEGRLTRTGALPCVGLVSLDEIMAELAPLPISTRLETFSPGRRGVFPRVLGAAFDRLPAMVGDVHCGVSVAMAGSAVSSARGFGALMTRLALGLPAPGRHVAWVSIAASGKGEAWTRRFGASSFSSRLRTVKTDPGRFEERFGPATFRFSAVADARGFDWIQEGWRIGPLPLPDWLGPRIRARCFERDETYRFRVVVAHPWLGVLMAYAGRLTMNSP